MVVVPRASLNKSLLFSLHKLFRQQYRSSLLGSINWFELQHNICFTRDLNHIHVVMGFGFMLGCLVLVGVFLVVCF